MTQLERSSAYTNSFFSRRWRQMTHRFDDPEIDREFVIANNLKAARQASAGFAYGTFGYAMLGVIIWFIDTAFFESVSLFLYAVVVPSHTLAAVVARRMGRVYLFQWLLVLANLITASCSFYILWLAPEYFALKYGYGLVISINIYAYTLLRMRFFFSTLTAVLVLAPFYYMSWFHFNMPTNDFVYVVHIEQSTPTYILSDQYELQIQMILLKR